jgi:hypothetical protein
LTSGQLTVGKSNAKLARPRGGAEKNEKIFIVSKHRKKEMAAICIRYDDREGKSKAHKIESICFQRTRENNDEFSCSCIFWIE